MSPVRFPDLYRACSALAARIIKELSKDGKPPQIAERIDMMNWHRSAQELFTLRPIKQWTASALWWRDVENLEEMRQLRVVIQNFPVLASRVDTMVGTHFSGRRRELLELVHSLVHDLVMANGSWDFEEGTFDAAYQRLEAVLAAETVTFTDFAPLLGFDGDQSVEGQQITAGVVLRRMTDVEISLAVQRAAIPIDQYMTTTMMLVSRFNQWALTAEHTHPLQTGDTELTAPPAPPPLPTYADEIPTVLAAIRLICGGSTTTSSGIRTDSLGQGYSAALTPIGPTDPSRPTVLAGQDALDRVRTAYQHLTHPAVIADRPLSTATRQVVLAGSRGLVQDRLLNLVTAGEALFIKRPGHSGPGKASPLADGAAGKLTGDPTLGRPTRANIKALIHAVYGWRNTEVHGDEHRTAPLRRLDGTATHDLATVAEDLDRMMRRAVLLALEDASQASGRP